MRKKIFYIFLVFFTFFLFSNITYSNDESSMTRIQNSLNDSKKRFDDIINREKNLEKTLAGLDEEGLKKMYAEYKIAEKNGDPLIANLRRKDLKEIARKLAPIYKDSYSLNNLYLKFRDILTYSGRNLRDVCIYLLGILSVLEVLMMLVEKPAEMPIGKIGWVLTKYGILRFFISFWLYFTLMFMGAAARLASIAAKVSGTILMNPSNVWYFYSEPVINSYEGLSFFGDLIVGYIVWAIVLFPALCLSGLIAIDYFMSDLEYRLLTGFSIVLLPFIAFKHTISIGSKVFAVLSSQIVKIMFLYFFTAIGTSVITRMVVSFHELGSEGMRILFEYTAVLYVIKILVGKTPAFASALMTGAGGVMSGRDISGAVGSAVAKVIGVTTMAVASSNYLKNRASKIAGRMRNAANLNRRNK